MKNQTIKIKAFAIILTLMGSSCIEHYKISTKVNIDGTLERMLQVVADDSASVFKGNLIIPVDTSWKITTRWFHENPKDTSSEKKFEYTATRRFINADDLNDYLKVESDTSKSVKIVIEFQKRFRWFYTYVTYNETYKKNMPFNHYPIEDFMSDSELSFYFDDKFIYSREHDSLIHISDLEQIPALNHSDSLRMDELQNELFAKLSQFIVKNLIEEYLNLLENELKSAAPEKYTYILNHKDKILLQAESENIFDHLFSETSKDPLKIIDSLLDIKEEMLEKIDPKEIKVFKCKSDNMSELILSGETIKNSVSMPGDILQTNADSIKNNQAFWNYNENYFFPKDYKLFAESRIINKWAFVVSGFVIISLLYLIFARIKRK